MQYETFTGSTDWGVDIFVGLNYLPEAQEITNIDSFLLCCFVASF